MSAYISNRKILYIDDEPSLLQAFRSLLRKEDYEISILDSSSKIDEVLKAEGPFAVILSDQRMPDMQGVEVLERVTKIHPETVRILVTGYSDYNDTLRAINVGGISRYIAKPWNDGEIKAIIHDAVKHYNLIKENQYLLQELQKSNLELTELLEGTMIKTVRLLSDLIGYVNEEAASQTVRIRKLGQVLLSTMSGLTSQDRWNIMCALDLFNLGIALIPAWIQVSISKAGLSALSRFPAAQNHHLLASTLLENIPRFNEVARIIKYQTKYFNGTGEPEKEPISGKDIPLGARLLLILLDYDRNSTDNFKGELLLRDMMNKPHKYDVDIIAHILEHLKPQQQEPLNVISKENRKPNEIFHCTASQLVEGLFVLEDVVTDAGLKLISANTKVSKQELDFLRIWSNAHGDKIKEPIRVTFDMAAGQV